VVAAGEGVSWPAVGDEVTALTAGGGYAEFCVTHASHCLPVPAGLPTAEAAALPETLFTVWSNVFERGRLRGGETLLVHGGTSGIGTTAIQLAKARGARVFVTAGSDEKCAACTALGADLAINYRAEDYVKAVKQSTGGRGVDVILDMVGGSYFERNLHSLAEDGRHVSIAAMEGAKVQLNLNVVSRRRFTVTGSTLRPQSVEEKGRIAAELRREIWPLVEAGQLRPIIHATFLLEQAAEAHAALDAGDHIGKIVLLTATGGAMAR
jgi:putative PIG3 family NAD(P)H quinone oxidoreductase